jgi:hypothetical protein
LVAIKNDTLKFTKLKYDTSKDNNFISSRISTYSY